MTSLPRKPTIPIGIEPTMTYQPKRWSRLPRYSGLNRPCTQADAIRQMSLAEVEEHRGDRAHLDHRGEGGHRRVVDLEAEQLLGDGQVTGAGDREELGEPLDDARG